MRKLELTGRIFGRWTVLGPGAVAHGSLRWACLCECGTQRDVKGANLQIGASTGCGCARDEKGVERLTEHGQHGTRTYQIWKGMLDRCRRPKNKSYPDYGGRGITFDPTWAEFPAFLADMGEAPVRAQIDREDNDGPYCKGNCHWTTSKINNRNRRNNLLIEYQGRRMTAEEASELTGIGPRTLRRRHHAGETGDYLFRPTRGTK